MSAGADLTAEEEIALLSDAQIREFKTKFELFDKDGGGSIDASELLSVLRSVGQNPSQEELNQMVKEIDTDGNGSIEFDEFLQMMTARMREAGESEEDLAEAFTVLDQDGTGCISANLLQRVVLSTLGESLSDEEVAIMIRQADIEDKGYITEEDFKRIITWVPDNDTKSKFNK